MQKRMVWGRPAACLLSGILMALAGCDSPDEKLASMATENAKRQAQQSQVMVQLQQHVAEGTKQLVSTEAESRRQWIRIKRDIEQKAAEIGRQRDALEAERRAIAAQRNRDPIIAAAIESIGLIVACLIPLCVAWHALHVSEKHARDGPAMDVLLGEFLRPELSSLPRGKPALRLSGKKVSRN